MGRSRERSRTRRGRRRTARRRWRRWAAVGAAVALVAVVVWLMVGINASGSGQSGQVAAGERVLGDPSAPVTIVEYGDFKCPFCARFFVETEPRLRERYIDTGQVRLVWRDFPNIDGESSLAAEAGRCAHAQDGFWELHDTLYTFIWDTYYGRGINVEGRNAYRGELDRLAAQAGLDVDRFRTCLDAGTYREAVADERQRGQNDGVRGTPTFFVNGQRVVGAQPFEVFAGLIDAELDR